MANSNEFQRDSREFGYQEAFGRVLAEAADAPLVRRQRVTPETVETQTEEALGVALAHRAVVLAYL